jgi:hypothetical protein
MDPNISKETTDKERVVTECAESQTYGTINRWSDFHVPIHSAVFAMGTQFCRREMDEGIKKNIWSVMEDFSNALGGKDFSKMKTQYTMFVDDVVSKEPFEKLVSRLTGVRNIGMEEALTRCLTLSVSFVGTSFDMNRSM